MKKVAENVTAAGTANAKINKNGSCVTETSFYNNALELPNTQLIHSDWFYTWN